MIRNWQVTATLMSPIAADPPQFDSILEWELAKRLGLKHHNKVTRATPIEELEPVPIPLAKRTFERPNDAGQLEALDVYCCSDPIIPEPLAEWVDHSARRFDTTKLALMLDPSQRKNLLTASGPYKMLFKPIRVRLLPSVSWFIRGDRKECYKLLKSIFALGHLRNWGYGLVSSWGFEEMEEDYSLFAPGPDGRRKLMKTLPYGEYLDEISGWRRSFGGMAPPYWHPDRAGEIAIPC